MRQGKTQGPWAPLFCTCYWAAQPVFSICQAINVIFLLKGATLCLGLKYIYRHRYFLRNAQGQLAEKTAINEIRCAEYNAHKVNSLFHLTATDESKC